MKVTVIGEVTLLVRGRNPCFRICGMARDGSDCVYIAGICTPSSCYPDLMVRVATLLSHAVDDPPPLASIPGHRSPTLDYHLCPSDVPFNAISITLLGMFFFLRTRFFTIPATAAATTWMGPQPAI